MNPQRILLYLYRGSHSYILFIIPTTVFLRLLSRSHSYILFYYIYNSIFYIKGELLLQSIKIIISTKVSLRIYRGGHSYTSFIISTAVILKKY